VEAAGVEPASESIAPQTSTCVSLLGDLARRVGEGLRTRVVPATD
jgi:hypothetical protein